MAVMHLRYCAFQVELDIWRHPSTPQDLKNHDFVESLGIDESYSHPHKRLDILKLVLNSSSR
jgi:hypothetical protein